MLRQVTELALRPQGTTFLTLIALCIGSLYVGLTFSPDFLAGYGPFWDYPSGPWLEDFGDVANNVDNLDYLVAYTGLVRSPWALPLFHVAAIGAPAGTSVVFLDVVPIAALLGRIGSSLSGHFLLPYGAWMGMCFLLSPVFATLMLAEGGQRSLLAAVAASILAVSSPTLLHRFGHLPLVAHFLILGAFYLYLRERHPRSRLSLFLCWSAWLSLALLTNPYMFAMVGAIYAASLTRYWRHNGIGSRWIEPILIVCLITLLMFELGFIGSGASLSGGGFGYYSMNLFSPFVPQRSGIFPSMTAIIDGTGGQYEGFNYLGLGGLVLLTIAILIDPPGLFRVCLANRELAVILLMLTLFALSSAVWAGEHEILKINIGYKLRQLSGIYRSSGRMFWPTYYILLLGSLMFVLAKVSAPWRLPLIASCCVLQLLDSEPLRARMTSLSSHGGTPLLNQAEWSPRIAQSNFVSIYPSYFCSNERQRVADIELQLLSIRADKSFNVAYNPRLRSDCAEDAKRVLKGPWSSSTLYVFLKGPLDLEKTWAPIQLACTTFAEGEWCFGNRKDDQGSIR